MRLLLTLTDHVRGRYFVIPPTIILMGIKSEHHRHVLLQFLKIELLDALLAKNAEYHAVGARSFG